MISQFKLIAIRPLVGCAPEFRKILIENEVYKFYADYHFKIVNNSVVAITHIPTIPTNLYEIKTISDSTINVNISAIVGKNGSGKSSLLELFYLSVYLISIESGLRIPNIKWIEEKLNEKSLTEKEKDLFTNLKKKIEYIYENLKVEIYYAIDSSISCLRINKGYVDQYLIDDDKSQKRNYKIKSLLEETNFEFLEFFYTIAVNYSLYGLNSEQIGDWVDNLFHKNDGYQTPIVINPYREEGIININRETHLAQSRLICNLINNSSFQIKEVLKGKVVEKIIFGVRKEKTETIYNYSLSETISRFSKREKKTIDEIFELIYTSILNIDYEKISYDKNKIKYFAKIVQYVIGKTIKIAHQYGEYNDFKDYDEFRSNGKKANSFPSIKNFAQYLEKLKIDKSHVTLKLRQILNTIRFNLLAEDSHNIWENDKFTLSVDDLKKRIEKILDPSFNVLEIIPAAFFIPQVVISNNQVKNEKANSGFTILSSGELQLIHTLQSIYYHIINVNSVHSNSLIKYENINILLDEVELCFHPEFQRNFIFELLNGISQLNIDSIRRINILFSTHSPFILSDIPNGNILRIQKGVPHDSKLSEQTFGANIHDLLANDFFMEEGFMGEWAKVKIKSL